MDKEVKEFVRRLENEGWDEKHVTGTGHLRMVYRLGGSITLPMTPSDRRWIYNQEANVKRIYAKYGFYKKPEKEEEIYFNGRKGLDYIKQEKEPMQQITLVKTEEQFKPVQTFMSVLNKDLIVSLLKKRREEIIEKLGPLRPLMLELDQIVESIKNLTGESLNWRDEIKDEVKIKEYIETKTITRGRFDGDQVYKAVKEVLKANNNEMQLEELSTWMEEVHGLQASSSQTVSNKIVAYISLYNKNNPGKQCLALYPEKEKDAKRVGKYESVKYKPEYDLG